MAFISPDVAVALVRATLAICGDRATGYPDQPGVRWGLRHPRRRRRKGESDTVVNNRYLYGFIFIVVYIVRLFATRFYYYHPV